MHGRSTLTVAWKISSNYRTSWMSIRHTQKCAQNEHPFKHVLWTTDDANLINPIFGFCFCYIYTTMITEFTKVYGYAGLTVLKDNAFNLHHHLCFLIVSIRAREWLHARHLCLSAATFCYCWSLSHLRKLDFHFTTTCYNCTNVCLDVMKSWSLACL